jgi:hypothetical protein
VDVRGEQRGHAELIDRLMIRQERGAAGLHPESINPFPESPTVLLPRTARRDEMSYSWKIVGMR